MGHGKAEKYDMKEAYNKDLTKSARFNYLKNAMHDKKGMSMKDEGMMMKDEGMYMMGQVKQGSMATMRSGNVGNYTGNHPRFASKGMSMNADLAYNPVDDITQNKGAADMAPIANLNKGYGQQVGKPSVASRQKYGGNKGDESMSDRDYSAPTKMYGGKKGDMSKSRRDYK
jgi:hypothetical protein|tara:strand:+ start:1001 stop:1513 length:513 start_codon:yes stop_codon:yes gene_type:complete